MSMGAPSISPSYDFRIIENFETLTDNKYELQVKRWWWGWKTVRRNNDIGILKYEARKFRKGFRVVEEFN